jgi:hypothetical protein
LTLLWSGVAGAAEPGSRALEVPSNRPLSGQGLNFFHDRILTSGSPSEKSLRARAAAQRYRSPDGYSIELEVSPAYIPCPACSQALVDFLASRLHDFEFGYLKIYVGPPEEMEQICGEGALACYATFQNRMYVPGDSSSGVPIEYPITHEYGHHLARWRSNTPWAAFAWGPKYWASENFICAGVSGGLFFPGDQGTHYFDNPGEGFADAYAHRHYPDVPWQYSTHLIPDAADFAAIERDAKRPWKKPRVRRFRGRLGNGTRSKTFRLPIQLDGRITGRLKGPRRANFNVEMRWGKRLLTRTRRPGSDDAFALNWCRDTAPTETATARVVRKRGSGPFVLELAYPG